MKLFKILLLFLFVFCNLYAQMTRVSMDNGRLVPQLLNYQGYLTDTTGIPIDDSLDMTFKIFDAVSSGNELWSETQTSVPIERGVFSIILGEITPIPDSVFDDFSNTWFELTLEGPQTLAPRTRITSVGYAYTSTYSDTAEFARVGAADNDWIVNSNRLYPAGDYGLAMRSSNVMWGSNLNTHVNFGVSCTTGTLLQNYNYCTIGGGYRNRATHSAATVAGGYQNTAAYHYAAVGGGRYNYNAGYYSVIPGGYADTITATGDYSYLFGINSNLTQDSTFMVDMPHIWFGNETGGYEFPTSDGLADQTLITDGSGQLNWSDVPSSSNWSVTDSVLYTNNYWGLTRGGADNALYGDFAYSHVNLGVACTTGYYLSNNSYCTVSGGYQNSASDWYATIGGGLQNIASDWYATVGGGLQNTASNNYTTIGGGDNNQALEQYATIGGGWNNTAGGLFSTIGGGYWNTAIGDYAAICGGQSNLAAGDYATVVGGQNNLADSAYTTIGGGYYNKASGDYAAVSGGYYSHALGYCTYVGGGYRNNAVGYCAFVGGGYADTTRADYGGVASGWHNTAGDALTDTAAFVGGGKDNAAFAPYANVGGGYADTVWALYGGVASGWHNTAGDASNDTAAFVGGGKDNAAFAPYANVGGGYADTVYAVYGGIGSGYSNLAGDETADTAAAVAGGLNNSATGKYSFVGGGRDNIASADYASVASGFQNTASGNYAVVAGGYDNTASSYASFAANSGSQASHNMSAAFTISHTTAPLQVRAMAFSTGTLVFSMDHPSDPMNKILNQHAVGSSEAILLYNGTATIEENGRVEVLLPDYFEKINRNACIQITGVGSSEVVFVAEDLKGNSFIIGGQPGTKVYWTVTGERTDIHAEIARTLTPVVQEKTGDLIGHSLDDDALIGIYDRLQQEKPGMFSFKTEEGRRVHEQSKQTVESRE